VRRVLAEAVGTFGALVKGGRPGWRRTEPRRRPAESVTARLDEHSGAHRHPSPDALDVGMNGVLVGS
jgi:hypothetical protein